MHIQTIRAINREYQTGVKIWKIAEEREISIEMAVAALVEFKTISRGAMKGMVSNATRDRFLAKERLAR
jgi:hypothetical protein